MHKKIVYMILSTLTIGALIFIFLNYSPNKILDHGSRVKWHPDGDKISHYKDGILYLRDIKTEKDKPIIDLRDLLVGTKADIYD